MHREGRVKKMVVFIADAIYSAIFSDYGTQYVGL